MRKNILMAGTMVLLAVTVIAQQKKQIHKTLPATAKSSFAAGEDVYTQFCVSCHLPDGGGVENMNPPLINTSYINGDKARIITTVLNGMSQQEIDGERYNNVMPAFNYLTDKQVADVLTFVRNSFGNKKPAVTVADVKATRAKLVK
ncbi:MAG: cytochrome c [Ferruginibacter sp.]|nr:cytochrome c [Ferruginibacter sp.]